MVTKQCVACGTALPQHRRSDRRYCGCRCRVRAYRIREGVGKYVRAARPRSHTALAVAAGATGAVVASAVLQRAKDREQAKQRRELERRNAQLTQRIETLTQERDNAVAEVKRLREETQAARQDLQRQREQNAQLTAASKQLRLDLRVATQDTEGYRLEWNASELREEQLRAENESLRDMLANPALYQHGYSAAQMDASLRVRILKSEIKQLQEQLDAANIRILNWMISKSHDSSHTDEIARLKEQLSLAEEEKFRQKDKIKLLKKYCSELLEAIDKAEKPPSLLHRVAVAIGLIGAGAVASSQATRFLGPKSEQQQLREADSPRLLTGKSDE